MIAKERLERMTRQNPDPAISRVPASSVTTLRIASLVLVVLTIIALGAVAYFTEKGIVASRDWVIHTYQVRSQLDDLQLEIMRARANETAVPMAERNARQPPLQREADLVIQTVNTLRTLTSDNPRQQQRLGQLGPLLEESNSLMERHRGSSSFMNLAPDERHRQEQIMARKNQVDAIIRSMQNEEDNLLDQRLTAWNYLFKRNVLMLGLAFAAVTLMLAYNFRLLMTEVVRTKDTEKRARANADSYRLMSARILELQDSERRRIARELHDSVGQFLAGLKINLSQLQTGNNIDAPSLIRETLELTDSAIQEVRTISHLLHPPLLEELGFLSAARWYVDEYGKRSQVKVSLLIDEPIERLPKDIEMALFRVLQETLTNVYRHSGARSVNIRISCRDGFVHLTVADDGKGIPDDVLAKFRGGSAPGIGLAGMRERLAEFGGQINVESSSAGAVVEAVIPTGTDGHKKDPRHATESMRRPQAGAFPTSPSS
jgi:signal transduction histidine kinase